MSCFDGSSIPVPFNWYLKVTFPSSDPLRCPISNVPLAKERALLQTISCVFPPPFACPPHMSTAPPPAAAIFLYHSVCVTATWFLLGGGRIRVLGSFSPVCQYPRCFPRGIALPLIMPFFFEFYCTSASMDCCNNIIQNNLTFLNLFLKCS